MAGFFISKLGATMNQNEKLNAISNGDAAISKSVAMHEEAHATGQYEVSCYGKDGKLKWKDTIKNLVTTAGKNFALDTFLAGSAYTAAWYLGLVSITSYTAVAITDTAASHSGWTEDQNYSQASRPTAAWSSASGGSKALSAALSFSMNASTTIKGCFLISNSTKGGTTGTLYSAGLFTGGDKVVQNGDTLNVSYTASL
jgi:hypothetical protein